MRKQALILAAHGSRQEPSVNASVRALANELAGSGSFCEVRAAFHQGEPSFSTALDGLDCDEAVVVPVMTSEGYYCDHVLPREMTKNHRFGQLRVRQTKPVGTHAQMASIVHRRAGELAARFGIDRDRALLAVIGHGTSREPRSRLSTERLVGALQRMGCYGDVKAFFLDERPGVEEIVSQDGTDGVIVVPFLIGAGPHVLLDIPRRLGIVASSEASPPFVSVIHGCAVACDSAIGTDPGLVEIIADLALSESSGRIVDAPITRLGRTPNRLRLGTRASALARWQAEHVAARLQSAGAHVTIVELSTVGDRQTDRPIADLPGDAPFTADIEAALAEGRIDLAVHSLKDLSVAAWPGLCLAAILRRGPAGESLVANRHVPLTGLPAGAFVGTSSPRRAAQVLAMRPDLRIAPIRGPVEGRVRQVSDGRFDAAILATAGLQRLGLMHAIAEELPIRDFVPAPGQGALAVQARQDDEAVLEWCAALDHDQTRRAVAAELALFRPFEFDRERIAAAYAEVGERISLHARLLSPDGSTVRDVNVVGNDPAAVASSAIERLAPMTFVIEEASNV